MSFEKLMDGVEELDKLLDEGPEIDKSEMFLKDIQMEANEIARLASNLTVADVDAEFTDEGDSDDGEQESESR